MKHSGNLSNIKRRTLSLLLCAVLCISSVPLSALPVSAAGVTEVDTEAELQAAVDAGGEVKLAGNIF